MSLLRFVIPAALASLAAVPLAAQEPSLLVPENPVSEPVVPDPEAVADAVIRDVGDTVLSDFLWLKRPIVVFADSPADPRYVQQMQNFSLRLGDLAERDVVVLTDTDPAAKSALREKLRPRGFMWVLIGKDGEIELRKPLPWDVREISRTIDKMPIRQQEIRDRRAQP